MRFLTSLFLFIACCNTTSLSAQDFYIKAGVGYATSAIGERQDGAENILSGNVTGVNTVVTSPGLITLQRSLQSPTMKKMLLSAPVCRLSSGLE